VTVTRLRSLTGLALASTVLLTGCGSVPDLNPGVAARVGDDTVSMSRVDDVTTSYCAAAEKQLQSGQVLPQHYLRGQVAGGLALRAAAEQFAAEHGVTAAPEYDQAVAQAEDSLKTLPADQRQALIDVQGAPIFVQAVERSVGEAILEGAGTSSPKPAAAQAAGQKAFTTWLADHDVRIDPRLGVTIDEGSTAPADTSLSFPVGDTAKTADATSPDSEYAGTLPDSQRCG
jgi:hypothetical protein